MVPGEPGVRDVRRLSGRIPGVEVRGSVPDGGIPVGCGSSRVTMITGCECGSAETGLACFCCVTCGSAWCDWLGEHPPRHTCNHRWTTADGPDDPSDTGVHSCALTPHERGAHVCKCRAKSVPLCRFCRHPLAGHVPGGCGDFITPDDGEEPYECSCSYYDTTCAS